MHNFAGQNGSTAALLVVAIARYGSSSRRASHPATSTNCTCYFCARPVLLNPKIRETASGESTNGSSAFTQIRFTHLWIVKHFFPVAAHRNKSGIHHVGTMRSLQRKS